ncbi:hypothetical protein RDABS01_038709 [Bienertia sinuspersici]
MKIQKHSKRVISIKDKDGVWCSRKDRVADAFVEYYKDLLGTEFNNKMHVNAVVVHVRPIINDEQSQQLLSPVTADEIKMVIFVIPGTKAPSPNGNNSTFFKQSWDHNGDWICKAVMEFMHNGKLLREVNCTNLVLILKVDSPSSLMDCCNTIYKIACYLLCNRLRRVLPDFIALNQSVFIQGRRIVHNIYII